MIIELEVNVAVVSLLKWLMVLFSLLGKPLIVVEVLVRIVLFKLRVIIILFGVLDTVVSLNIIFVVEGVGVEVISIAVLILLI